MVRTKEELLSRLSTIIGDNNSDEAIEMLEDMTDTLTDYEARTSEDWKTKYEENDAAWRKRYIDRFQGTDPTEGDNELVVEESLEETMVDESPVTYEDLFKESEVK